MSRIHELEILIKYHKAKYYQGRPEIIDIEYDKLESELKELDPHNHVLSIVGSQALGQDKVFHEKKMLSLNKTYHYDDLLSWIGDNEVISMYKYDGVSCSLVYENGELVLGKTRGDGSVGENITLKNRWMLGIPTVLRERKSCEVRGELYCCEENFFNLSKEMEAIGLERPTSQRNIVAGLIGRKDNLELNRYIQFCAFDFIEKEKIEKTEVSKFLHLKELGFSIPEIQIHKGVDKIKEVLHNSQEFMMKGDFQIDGVVFSYNDLKLHAQLGETAHHPRYKMAFKFQGEAKNTTIEKLIWQVSRNGILTPIAQVKPVDLSGAKIARVTLHNYGLVNQFKLKANDKIQIIRSGEVIPKFLKLIESSNTPYTIPENCPSCGKVLEKREIRLICINEKCPAQIKETILNFIQKIGIEDLSSKRLDEMIRMKIVRGIEDLYKITKDDLMTLNKVKEKLAEKLLRSIHKSKETDLITFLSALGLQGGAYNKCERIVCAGYDTIEKILSLSLENLCRVDGFAEKSSEEFIKSLRKKEDLISSLLQIGFKFEKRNSHETIFSKKKICITGTLSRKRSDIESVIREIGAAVVSSVSKKTDYLLTNEKKPSSTKFKKAILLDIPILSEEEFFNKIKE